MYKYLVLSLSWIACLDAANLEIDEAMIALKHHGVSDAQLYYNGNDFIVKKNNKQCKIQNYDVDKTLHNITPRQLAALQQVGHLVLKKLSNGDYKLESRVHGDGGFLLTGVIVYQTTRVLGHAGVWIGAGGMIVTGFATGGPAGAAAGYLTAVSMIPTASAAVETGSLAIGTAASFIPGLP